MVSQSFLSVLFVILFEVEDEEEGEEEEGGREDGFECLCNSGITTVVEGYLLSRWNYRPRTGYWGIHPTASYLYGHVQEGGRGGERESV